MRWFDLLKNFIGHNENGTFVEQMVNWMYWFFMAISFIALSSPLKFST